MEHWPYLMLAGTLVCINKVEIHGEMNVALKHLCRHVEASGTVYLVVTNC